VVEHISLIIAQIAYWVVPVIGIIEIAEFKFRQSVQVQHLLEIANSIGREVQVLKTGETIQTHPDCFEPIGS